MNDAKIDIGVDTAREQLIHHAVRMTATRMYHDMYPERDASGGEQEELDREELNRLADQYVDAHKRREAEIA